MKQYAKVMFDNERVPSKVLISTAGLERNEVDELFKKIVFSCIDDRCPVSYSKSDDWSIHIGLKRSASFESKINVKNNVQKLVTNFEVYLFEQKEVSQDLIFENVKSWLAGYNRYSKRF